MERRSTIHAPAVLLFSSCLIRKLYSLHPDQSFFEQMPRRLYNCPMTSTHNCRGKHLELGLCNTFQLQRKPKVIFSRHFSGLQGNQNLKVNHYFPGAELNRQVPEAGWGRSIESAVSNTEPAAILWLGGTPQLG
ncbi:hypothetical protein B0H13DRAFT_1879573 [Mycena leptocephala]|nr:hypothetical protein B0H13DRAFT_1879573 [Mycena leptocephala]